MATLVTRAGKGSALTHNEVDANFTNLNTDKAELSGAAFTGNVDFAAGVDVTGNITVTGTVDGRDIATDGSKLDGIEASADVTDTANVTSAGALMDSELTALASVKAINQGLATTDSPTFAAATVNGNIVVTGTVDGRDIAANIPSSLGSAGQFLAVNSGASATEWVDAPAAGTHNFTASGALSNGDMVVLNSDGTVSAVSESSVSASVGSSTTFNSGGSDIMGCVYDTANDKVVIAYKDAGNSNYGTAIVGTVSGNSITFGTEVVFATENTGDRSAVTFDEGQGKVLIAFADASNNVAAIVGTVSGTSISFGSKATIVSNGSDRVDMVYDSTAGKSILAFQNTSQSNNTYVYALTISGTSVSAGSAANVTDTLDTVSMAFDPTAGKAVLFYKNSDNSNYPTVRKISVSGTTPSFESAVVVKSSASGETGVAYEATSDTLFFAWENASGGEGLAVAAAAGGATVTGLGSEVQFVSSAPADLYAFENSTASKVGVVYEFASSPFDGRFRYASISGTTITFDTETSFSPGRIKLPHVAHDPDTGKNIAAYRDDSNSNEYGDYTVFNPAYTSQNLTATNFIGVSAGAYSDTATATIQLIGAVDDAQSSLTIGSKYYVQTDGTLSTTADTPSVLAGTAISATEIIIKD